MTKIERIEKMLETEKKIHEREDKEVTVDYASVRGAENRAECLKDVLKVLKPLCTS